MLLKSSGWASAGLPLSTSEGRLIKAYSEFGEVRQGDNIFCFHG